MMLRLDIGCGSKCKEGFVGVDSIDFGQKYVLDITKEFPWEDNSIDEVYCSHFIEHLTWPERIDFFNNLYRAMKPDARMTLIWPHWASARYYGDPTHTSDTMSEFALHYLYEPWRRNNAPHAPYTCNFEAIWKPNIHPSVIRQSTDFQQFALAWYKEACQDIIATLTKR